MAKQVIYVSATPADYELMQSEGIVVEQVIRPTGLLDPIIEVRPSHNQIDDLMEEIQLRIERNERTLITTLNMTYWSASIFYVKDWTCRKYPLLLFWMRTRRDSSVPTVR